VFSRVDSYCINVISPVLDRLRRPRVTLRFRSKKYLFAEQLT